MEPDPIATRKTHNRSDRSRIDCGEKLEKKVEKSGKRRGNYKGNQRKIEGKIQGRINVERKIEGKIARDAGPELVLGSSFSLAWIGCVTTPRARRRHWRDGATGMALIYSTVRLYFESLVVGVRSFQFVTESPVLSIREGVASPGFVDEQERCILHT